MSKEETLSLLETIAATGFSSTHLYWMLRTGKLKGEKDTNGHWWIPKSAVEGLKAKRSAQ